VTAQANPPGRASTRADVILIGCVRTKRATACPAAELFASPLFEGRRRHAVGTGLPWYILSAKFGLLAPEDVIGPYDVYLADQSPAYRKAWGELVTAQLEQRHPDLRDRAVEVHAGAAYVEPLRAPLGARGAELTTPLEHLRQGEQLAWQPTEPTLDADRTTGTVQLTLICDRPQASGPWPAGPVHARYTPGPSQVYGRSARGQRGPARPGPIGHSWPPRPGRRGAPPQARRRDDPPGTGWRGSNGSSCRCPAIRTAPRLPADPGGYAQAVRPGDHR